MKLTFQIVITDESGSSRTEELMSLQKSGDALNDIGLSVSESKQLLGAVQKSLVQQQADEYIHQNIQYPMSSLPYEAQNQRRTKNLIPDVVWRYSCIRTSGVSMPL